MFVEFFLVFGLSQVEWVCEILTKYMNLGGQPWQNPISIKLAAFIPGLTILNQTNVMDNYIPVG